MGNNDSSSYKKDSYEGKQIDNIKKENEILKDIDINKILKEYNFEREPEKLNESKLNEINIKTDKEKIKSEDNYLDYFVIEEFSTENIQNQKNKIIEEKVEQKDIIKTEEMPKKKEREISIEKMSKEEEHIEEEQEPKKKRKKKKKKKDIEVGIDEKLKKLEEKMNEMNSDEKTIKNYEEKLNEEKKEEIKEEVEGIPNEESKEDSQYIFKKRKKKRKNVYLKI